MLVLVHSVETTSGSLAIGEGVDESEDFVRFVGEPRMMSAIGEAIEAGEDVEVDVEEWQIV